MAAPPGRVLTYSSRCQVEPVRFSGQVSVAHAGAQEDSHATANSESATRAACSSRKTRIRMIWAPSISIAA